MECLQWVRQGARARGQSFPPQFPTSHAQPREHGGCDATLSLRPTPHKCQGSIPPLMYISGRGGRQGEMRPPSVHSSGFGIAHMPALAPS